MFRTALTLILPAVLLSAQGRPRVERPRPGPRPEARRDFRRDRLMAQIHQLRMNKVQKALGVPEEKARVIADRWTQFDQDSVTRRQEMRRLREQVSLTLVGPGSEEEKNTRLRPVVEQLAILRRQQQEKKHAFEEAIRADLSPAQQGRFIILAEEFDQSVREAIAEERKGK